MDAMDTLFLPLMLAMLVVFLLLSFRNQKKRAAAMAELRAQAVPGARVQLSSGLYGTVRRDDGGEDIEIEIAPGVVTTWNRLAIREVVGDDGGSAAGAGAEVAGEADGSGGAEPGGDSPQAATDNPAPDK